MRQADHTLSSARADAGGGFYAWACFKAHQASEYALKAVLRGLGLEAFGHDLLGLWMRAKEGCPSLKGLRQCILLLNRLYIPTRHPDAWPGGATPFEGYSERDAEESLECSSRVFSSVRECLNAWCEGEKEED